jgi:hypothetical protein
MFRKMFVLYTQNQMKYKWCDMQEQVRKLINNKSLHPLKWCDSWQVCEVTRVTNVSEKLPMLLGVEELGKATSLSYYKLWMKLGPGIS